MQGPHRVSRIIFNLPYPASYGRLLCSSQVLVRDLLQINVCLVQFLLEDVFAIEQRFDLLVTFLGD